MPTSSITPSIGVTIGRQTRLDTRMRHGLYVPMRMK